MRKSIFVSLACLAVLAVGFFVDPAHAQNLAHFDPFNLGLHDHFGKMGGAGIGLIGLSTSKVVLETIEQFMEGYEPTYRPIYPLFLGKSQAYSEIVGKLDFKRADTVGDIRAKHVTPKDTEMAQISVAEATKTFKKYFLANQFRLSSFQDPKGTSDVKKQVLDEHQKQMDELFLLGEGTSASTMINNGLFWSDDSNYVLNASPASVSDADDLHTAVMETVAEADAVAGRKIIVFYGEDTLPIFDSVYESAPTPFKRVLADVLGAGYEPSIKLPAAVTPASEEGWMIVNLDQIMVHYTALPSLKNQGINEESMYAWFNFLMGSSMLEVRALGGIVRQVASVS